LVCRPFGKYRIKQIGTNGGGFYGANGAHPFENPTGLSNFVTCLGMMLFPMALVLMYGRMLRRVRHALVIYAVMDALLLGMIGWAVYWDALQPNPGITASYECGSDSHRHPGRRADCADGAGTSGARRAGRERDCDRGA
jgi:K+-transporting ATPase A subunit